MIAGCLSNWDDFSLMFNRLTILAVCSWGAIFCGRRAFKHHTVSMVSRLVWMVPTVTMTVLVVMVAELVLRCQHELSLWERTIYGGLLIWTIAALLAVVISGHREVEKVVVLSERYQVELQEAVDELAQGRGDE